MAVTGKPVMYGIPNCGTIKKARAWLETHGVDYAFHDYKRQGVEERLLRDWVKAFGWEQVLNKRGMTWRKLDEELKATMDENQAIRTMLEKHSIIKRPILVTGNEIILGFVEDEYARKLTA